MEKGKLFIVPTPIGNLRDMTYRGVETLKEVDIIFAEDTRVSRKLLTFYNIEKRLISYHKYNEHKTVYKVIDYLITGKNVALISDAGTPGISDPGFLLIRECINNGIEVIVLPGATALIPALVNSGLPMERFVFEGFLPDKHGRKKRLEALAKEERTIIIYVPPHKLINTLRDLITYMGADRYVSVSREISKIFEQTIRGTLKQVKDYFTEFEPKGEFVIVIEGYRYYQKRKNEEKN